MSIPKKCNKELCVRPILPPQTHKTDGLPKYTTDILPIAKIYYRSKRRGQRLAQNTRQQQLWSKLPQNVIDQCSLLTTKHLPVVDKCYKVCYCSFHIRLKLSDNKSFHENCTTSTTREAGFNLAASQSCYTEALWYIVKYCSKLFCRMKQSTIVLLSGMMQLLF